MKVLFALLVFVYSNAVLATSQIMDEMEFESKNLQILNNPLEPVFTEKSKEWYEEVWLKSIPQFECSASWRGYYSQWLLSAGKLYLVGVFADPCSQAPQLINPGILLSERSYPIFADWFTGEIPVQISEKEIVENVIVDGEARSIWYICTTEYFIFENGEYKGSETRETYEDCYMF